MIGRVVALGAYQGREAAALIVDGRLEDLLLKAEDGGGYAPGAILRGIVDRPMKGRGGVFVRLPGTSGFLRETSGLAPGQPVLVQISGQAEPGKAQPVTTRLLFKGRLAIVTPLVPGLNISRRIRDTQERARLGALATVGMAGFTAGLILRSAAEGQKEDMIAGEIAALRELAEAVLGDAKGAPELLVDAPGPHEAAWRNWADPASDEVASEADCFARHGIDAMIDALRSPLVPFAGGGHMSIEPTRALIAVDVNTGPDTSPASSLKANISAARDLPRQLRLRGLGGQIIVDFAPMPKRDRPALEQQLRAAFKGESAETSLAGWTPLGNFELQRKRDRPPLAGLLPPASA